MNAKELKSLGISGPSRRVAVRLIARAAQGGMPKRRLREGIEAVAQNPTAHVNDADFGELARALVKDRQRRTVPPFVERPESAPWRRWGSDLDTESVSQLNNACRLPIAIAGALMPDAHVGYGLPIGGVLATDNAVIPYAVGVDIACRMKMSVYDLPPQLLKSEPDRLVNALERETRFGIGARFQQPRDHPVMDDDWSVTPITKQHKDKAWSQLGTSGSGNHFVEYGILTLTEDELGLKAGRYLALLSHSGSRGTGASVADHYSRLAMDQHPELPRELRHLAWLELDAQEGEEYWQAMSLMGRYAAANHAVIHRQVARALKADVIADVENHHNFAWREMHRDPHTGREREMIVHRKGATPAAEGVLGIIPGSMATPAYVVRGKGEAASLESASHGAGRVMSRRKAKQTFTWSQTKKLLREREVRLLSAGLDEVPMVYKDIDQVMSQQADLVTTIAQFDPRIVKMAPAGERPED